ncbi:hypothetical protein LCGC14_0832460 [marine sediment metagenome]|uniref:Uncharacterized protein n=1 Tax=marine sediment metagenome TaxID=412755 RepID=A0A0F9Q0Q3_9ZZZZ
MTIQLNGKPVAGFALGVDPDEDANRHFFDRYSIPHAAMGAMFEAAGVPPALAIGSHIAFELVENSLKRSVTSIWPDSRPDGWQNHVGDAASFAGGLVAARALKGTEGGKAALTGLVATAGAIWMWNLVQKHSWTTGRSAR